MRCEIDAQSAGAFPGLHRVEVPMITFGTASSASDHVARRCLPDTVRACALVVVRPLIGQPSMVDLGNAQQWFKGVLREDPVDGLNSSRLGLVGLVRLPELFLSAVLKDVFGLAPVCPQRRVTQRPVSTLVTEIRERD